MIKLNSFEISSGSSLISESNMIIGNSGSPLVAWLSDGSPVVRLSNGSVWYPQEGTSTIDATSLSVGLSGDNYLLFYTDLSSKLYCLEFDFTNNAFVNPVVVSEYVDIFSVSKGSSSIKVCFSVGLDLFVLGRNDVSRVWDLAEKVLTLSDTITSLSIDNKNGKTVVGYTFGNNIGVYQNPEDIPFVSLSPSGIPSDVHIGMTDASNFDIIYSSSPSGFRAIEHAMRAGSGFWQSQIVDDSFDNSGLDLFVKDNIAYVVFVQGGLVRYRERDGQVWSDLVGSTSISPCDPGSAPSVVFYDGYSRVLYENTGKLFYAGMPPFSQEMVVKFSSSSWEVGKKIDFSDSFVRSNVILNSVSQRVKFNQSSISIGGVSCYLSKFQENKDSNFDIVLSIFYADINGKPYSSALSSAVINSSDVVQEGWSEFQFNVGSMICPIDGFCFVIHQVGGDENNYVSWMGCKSNSDSGLFLSKDSINWELKESTINSLRVRGNFNAYSKIINPDPSQITNQISTPPAVSSGGVNFGFGDLSTGTFDNTYLVNVQNPSYYQPQTPVDQDARIYGYSSLDSDWRVEVNKSNLIVSFVIDSSGSMCWNDLFGVRQAIMRSMVDKLKLAKDTLVYFDFVNIGGLLADNVSVDLGTQKIDSATVEVSSISNSGGFDSSGNPISIQQPPTPPSPQPPLTQGQKNQYIFSQITSHLATGVLSFGFKGLRSGVNYRFYGLDLGWSSLFFTKIDPNWIDFWPSGSPTFSISNNGPNESSVLNFVMNDPSKDSVRFFAALDPSSQSSRLTGDFSSGSNSITTSGVGSIAVGDGLILTSPTGFNCNINALSVDVSSGTSSVIGLSRSTNFLFQQTSTVVDLLSLPFVRFGWEKTTTFHISLLDETGAGPVTFFVHTADGGYFEWAVTPIKSWGQSNLVYIGDTANVLINAVNSQGENLPDGTMVELYVNMAPPMKATPSNIAPTQQTSKVSQDVKKGSRILYLTPDQLKSFKRGDKIALKK